MTTRRFRRIEVVEKLEAASLAQRRPAWRGEELRSTATAGAATPAHNDQSSHSDETYPGNDAEHHAHRTFEDTQDALLKGFKISSN